MMKKLVFILALIASVCMLMSTAMAADTTILDHGDEEHWRSVAAHTVVGDTLYLLVQSSEGHALYCWDESMPQAELLTDQIFYAGYYGNMEEVEASVQNYNEEHGKAQDPQYVVSLLFSDGERLMGMNGYNGKIFALEVKDGAVLYQDVCTMADTSLLYHVESDYRYLVSTQQYAMAGDKLLYLAEDYDQEGWQKNRLLVIDITTGEVKSATVEHPQRLTAYKDGLALVVCRDEMNAYDSDKNEYINPAVMIYDPVADTVQAAGELDMDSIPYMTYSSKMNALVYAQNCRIMAAVDLGEPKQVGYIPQDWTNNIAVVGDTFLACQGKAEGRTISMDFKSGVSLNLYNDYMDAGTLAFTADHPQVAVYTSNEYYGTMEELGQAMVSGENTLDVIRMNTAYDQFFRLMEKGYCADLSGNAELMAYAQRMQPVLRDALMKDGKLYAIPVYAYSYDGWYVANGVMEEMGLTVEDIPTNFVELCQFATRWNDEWVEEYPQFTLIEYCEDYKQQLFYYMVSGYLNYCTATGQEVRFASPEFRAMLEALEAMRVDELNRGANLENEDEVGYRQGLLMPDYTVVGSFEWDTTYRTFVPMTLTANTDFVTGVNMEVVFINPRCENMDTAMELLLYKLKAVEEEGHNEIQAYTIFADLTEPVENPYYQRNIEAMEKSLIMMEAELAECSPEEKKDWEAAIENEKKYLDTYRENERWTISKEGIDRYQQQIVPNMYVIRPTFLGGSSGNAAPELQTLMERYLAGQIKLDQFIRDADNKLMMMQMEDY